MVVQKIENMEEYKQVCLASADRLVVIDYSASWYVAFLHFWAM